MKTNHKQLLFILILIGLFMCIDPIYAGPGGTIAKGLFKTWWGKLLIIAVCIILFPLILYTLITEGLKVRKTKKQLLKASLRNKDFSWLNLEKNFSNIITRVYAAWDKENMAEVQNYVNPWYWQNQQLVHLNRWKAENLKNVCRLKSITKIKPLYLELTDSDTFENSKIVISISADIEDYLLNKTTGKVIEGRHGYENEEHIWVMEYADGKWLLDDIKNGDTSLQYAKMSNIIPEGLSNQLSN